MQNYHLIIRSLIRRHHYHFLSLRLVRNPSGLSERFLTSGNDIYVALLITVLVILTSSLVKPHLVSHYVILALVLASSRIGPESFFFQKDSEQVGMTIMRHYL